MDEDFGSKIAKLVEGVLEMEAIRSLQTLHRSETSPEQVDNVRRMLLAMVEGCARRGDQAGGADRLPAGSEDGR